MANLLYLVHRLPYPPNKGDKVRSYHLLRHLAREHRVFLGTFVDDPDDEQHLDTVRGWCAGFHAARLAPRRARVASLAGLATGEALTLRYYRDAGLAAWVERTLAAERIDAVVVFSSSMVQYAENRPDLPLLVDFVDVDSAKWSEYAGRHPWPLSWLYRREGERLLAYERSAAARATRSFFVTDKETELFRSLAPESAHSIEPMCNGVDAEFFAPDAQRASPYSPEEWPLVFTGAMDYWPNIDAVTWFAREVLPALKRDWPRLRFHVVGRSPPPAVQALASESVNVTGTVPDVRPYLQHAKLVVAPLRLARGVQNKVLEAMAMARPVVCAQACLEAIDAEPGLELVGACEAADFQREVTALLRAPARSETIGRAARDRVLKSYSWQAHLSGLDRHLLLAPSLAGAAA
ncbi:MAG TPA: TIGR03087 family PEP-CTERM/XrtA system glycosyltransferase [Aquabacterium sp.]|nr:TIGR03087 family PEP-CTERM/XrtA system glycosyltransferase [Aquabacterium sp.]